ncbi:hypothetical protein BJ165DRAFT_1531862 [Panaeolus papilionaceus]|nr:hypothetical protein BJ165DRAFT_1531862 [Panaeolus papilionaceus]
MSHTTFHPDLLLSSRNSNAPIGPFDGLVAAHVAHHENDQLICTTPNQHYIPCPPTTSIHSPRIRADFRYGIHDYTLFPQPYVQFYSHLGAIPRKPSNNDPLAIMWWDPAPDDFVTSTGGVLLGTGALIHQKFKVFEEMNCTLHARVAQYRESTNPVPPQHALDLIATCATALSDAVIRLGTLKTSYTQMRFTVTELQRYYLELIALLDYMQIYQPRMRGIHPAGTTVDDRVGVFTLNEKIVQEFQRAGLPVWFVRPWTGQPFSNNILRVVDAIPSDARMEDHDPPFPPVYTGLLGGREVVDAIHQFSRNWFTFKDPFLDSTMAASSSLNPSSIRVPSKKSVPSKQQKPKARDGRNKFMPLEGPFAPFPIPTWAEGLIAVDVSYQNLIEASKSEPHFGHYVFPDPGVFTSATSDEKRVKLLRTWLLSRDAWMSCLVSQDSLALSAQAWRDFLFLDLSSPPEVTNTRKSARLQAALAKLTPQTLEAFHIEPQYATGQPSVWNNHQYNADELPPHNVVREILWELYELNFTYELICLDRRACINLGSDDTSLYERELIIQKCFPFLAYKMPTQPMPTTNRGLASDNPSERLTHVLQLAKLMSSWRGEKPAIFELYKRRSQDSISRQEASDLERSVAQFYCQTFYNYFGRAAQVPHRLYYHTL